MAAWSRLGGRPRRLGGTHGGSGIGWLSHSRGQFFLRRGGDKVAPPRWANMGITDICNLRCSICGSQNMLQPVNRRHMDIRIFRHGLRLPRREGSRGRACCSRRL